MDVSLVEESPYEALPTWDVLDLVEVQPVLLRDHVVITGFRVTPVVAFVHPSLPKSTSPSSAVGWAD